MRQQIELLAAHSRELVRLLISGILLLGTSAGTAWTFSNGRLTLSGAWELIVSVGGVVTALEVGAIYIGFHMGTLDSRIRTAKRREQQLEYRRDRRNIARWFAGVLAISFAANLIFRYQQLHSMLLAILVSIAPVVLICLFTIVLRPIPVDYAELGREAAQRGLLELTRSSSSVLVHHMRRIGRGYIPNEQEMQHLAFAASIVRSYAQSGEQQGLDYAIERAGGAKAIEASVEVLWDTGDIALAYGIPRRTAQSWVSDAPGRRHATKGKKWLVPQSSIIARYGLPKPSETHYSASQGYMQRTQSTAGDTQESATDMQVAVVEAQ